MSAPLSYASHASTLDKNQAMPQVLRPKAAKAKKEAAPEAAAVVPAAAAAPAPAKPAVKKEAPPKKEAPAPKEEVLSPLPSQVEKPAPAPRTYLTGYAMVKAVLSGDTLVLAGSANGSAPERTITLTGVLAPKFGRGKNQSDEPYAWESREYLRRHTIGQQVQFTVQHTHDASGRDYGTVSLKGTDIATQMLKAGWVKVKTGPAGKEGKIHPEKEALLAIEVEAAARGLGMHKKGADPKAHLRSIDWTPNAQALYAANKNTPINGVVDQVRDGSTLRVELIHPNAPLKHSMITLHLSGVVCPRTPLPLSVLLQQHERKKSEDPSYKGKAPTKEEKADAFALEAQAFTETRLLNREVQVLLQGVDKSGNLFGSIVFAKGNISEKLIEQGLGKYVAWSAALTPDNAKLKAAEAKAKAAKLRLYANASAEAEAAESALPGEFQGKVTSIASTDSIVVEGPDGSEQRFWLASVRAPRLAPPRAKDGKDEAYAQEAKEFLRSKLIGHKVRVVPEYVRASAADDKREARTFATIFQNKININEALIASGFAEALQHRLDEERSQFYDLYLAAEAKAKETNKGIHDPRQRVVTKITDLTDRVRLPRKKTAAKKPAAAADGEEADNEEEAKEEKAAAPSKAETDAIARNKQLSAKAKQYLVFLQRERQVNAVVEFVFSASRFKLLVPKENVLIALSLAGIRTPAAKGPDGKADPLAEEILQYVRAKVQQHSVKIEVETMDKADNFLGSLFINRQNLAVDLLQQGYASIFGFSAAKSPYAKDLYAAERQAKEARKGIWKDWVEPTPEEKAAMGEQYGDDDESKESGSAERTARITEIVDVADFFLQFTGDKNLEAVEKALQAVGEQPEPEEPFNAPANSNGRPFVAAGQFGDDSWHRVRCEGINSEGDWNVYFLDFGNYDTLPADRLRHLPAEAAKIPALAVHCALAGLAAPKNAEYQEGSAMAFSQMAFGLELKAQVEFSDKFGRKHVTLSHESHPITLNRQLLRDGWARVQARPDRRINKLLPELQEEEDSAKRNHYNMFEYGDVSDEEEGERVAGPDPRARPGRPGRK